MGCKNIFMANPSKVSVPEHPSSSHIFGRSRLIALLALLALLILCAVFSWTTRDAMAHLQFLRAQRGYGDSAGNRKTLVDQRPWQTIQALAPLAVSTEEMEFAHDAERLADHEVDQAFASAMRLAKLQAQRRTLAGDALALSTKVTQLKQLVRQEPGAGRRHDSETGQRPCNEWRSARRR